MSSASEEETQAAFMHYCDERREALRRIFGTEQPDGTILLPPTDLSVTCWFGGGVYRFPPTANLPHWHYVTEAISQPDDPLDVLNNGSSEYAFEFVISTKEDCHWAPNLLMSLARYYFSKRRPFYPYEAIPCGGPMVAGTSSKLTFLISVAAREYPPAIQLPGLTCNLVHMVGVAEDELQPALGDDMERGLRALHGVLCSHGIASCSIPERPSLARSSGFLDEWKAELARLA